MTTSTAEHDGHFAMISLHGGGYMLVSEHRAADLGRYRWHGYANGGTTRYARRYIPGRPWPHNIVTAHRQIAGYAGADHANGNGLDNRDRNLRKASAAQQVANQGLRSDNTSGYRGVVWNKGKWLARLKVDGKQRYLGRFDTPEAAARAWNAAASAQWPGFARLNVVPEVAESAG
jgi:hypothetical protein